MLFLLVSGTSSSHTRRAGTFLSRWLYDEVRDRGAVLKNTNSLFVTPRHARSPIVSWLCCSIVPSAPVRSERSSSLDDADDDHTAPTQVSRRCSSRATETPGPGPGDGTGTGRGAGRGTRQRNRNRNPEPEPGPGPGPEGRPANGTGTGIRTRATTDRSLRLGECPAPHLSSKLEIETAPAPLPTSYRRIRLDITSCSSQSR